MLTIKSLETILEAIKAAQLPAYKRYEENKDDNKLKRIANIITTIYPDTEIITSSEVGEPFLFDGFNGISGCLREFLEKIEIDSTPDEEEKYINTIIEYLRSESIRFGHSILYRIPEITVTNENKDSTVIKGVWVRLWIGDDYYLKTFEIARDTFNTLEIEAGYVHSHVPELTSNPSFSLPCLGEGPIADLIAKATTDTNVENYLYYILGIQDFLQVESLEGGPYIRMSYIKTDNIEEYNNSIKDIGDLEFIVYGTPCMLRYNTLDATSPAFILYCLPSLEPLFNRGYRILRFNTPLLNILDLLSRLYVQFLKECVEAGIISKDIEEKLLKNQGGVGNIDNVLTVNWIKYGGKSAKDFKDMELLLLGNRTTTIKVVDSEEELSNSYLLFPNRIYAIIDYLQKKAIEYV